MINFNMIFARSRNGVIGDKGAIPWYIPEDLQHFKTMTLDYPVIMGRKTWDSLPDKNRPLPGRTNIVLSKSEGITPGAIQVKSVEEAIFNCNEKEVWIIGGNRIYNLFMPYATKAVVTEVDLEVEGDTFAPDLDASWVVSNKSDWYTSSVKGTRFRFITYQRYVLIKSKE